MNKYICNIGFAIIALFATSCSSWLDIKPEDRVTDKQLYSTVAGFRASLNGIYIELNSSSLYGGELVATGIEVLAQRYDFSGTTSDISKVGNYNYTTDYAKAKFQDIWEKAYSLIANCNKLLEYAYADDSILKGASRDMIVGETLAIRAMLHFDLLRLFGPIYSINPDAESIPYNKQFKLSAGALLPASKVIEEVLSDLKQSAEMLKNSDPIIEKGPQNKDSEDGLNYDTYRTQRLNYYAVIALMARVNLYAGNDVDAVKCAKIVTEVQEKWFPFTEYVDVMGGTKNPDRIFSSELLFSTYNSKRNTIFNTYFSPSLDQSKVYLPKKNLDKFFIQEADKDWRYSPIWIAAAGKDFKCFHKYENVSDVNVKFNNLIPLLRITEMYYIIAEASTDSQEALDAINKVLYNRGLTLLTDSEDVLTTVQEEYKREFWGEGQLFFYYKRKNINKIYSFTEGKNIDMDATKYVVPLPKSQTDFM